MERGVIVAALAYNALLSIHPNMRQAYEFRVRNQSLLAHLRDYIAAETGADPETVQNKFEAANLPRELA